MDFDAVADELYRADRASFVALREEHAARARTAGERELGERIHALRKPTSAAALVNQLVRQRSGEVDALLDVADELRQAHRELAGDRLRTLARRRTELVRELTSHARNLAEGAVGESVAREVETTLEAAASDPETGRAVRVGRLTTALAPSDPFSASWLPTGSATSAKDSDERDSARRGRQRGKGSRAKQRRPTREAADSRHGEGESAEDQRAEAGPAAGSAGQQRAGKPGAEKGRRARVRNQRRSADSGPAAETRVGGEAAADAEASQPSPERPAADGRADVDRTPRERGERRASAARRRRAEVDARRARDEARKELRAAERAEVQARERTEAARAAFDEAQAAVHEATREEGDS